MERWRAALAEWGEAAGNRTLNWLRGLACGGTILAAAISVGQDEGGSRRENGGIRPTIEEIARNKGGPLAENAKAAPGTVLVKFKPGRSEASINGVLARNGIRVRGRRNLGTIDWDILKVESPLGIAEAVRAFRRDADVLFAEPDYEVSVEEVVPNDPSFGQLWGLQNTGQTGGTADADIDAPEAWSTTTGGSGFVLAVIDTGVDYGHEDLWGNIWTNPGEIPGNDVDDDGNGFVDDVHGYDFVNEDGDPMDDNRHGTHCSGTIGAVGNNGVGVSGVNWTCQIMALKALDANGGGYADAALRALDYVVLMKNTFAVDIRLTSNSWGGGGYSQAMYDAIKAAQDAGILFIAAAGNSSSDNDASPHYPSSFDLDNIIAVASTDHNDHLANSSNYGLISVDLAAPGVSIFSTVPGGYSSLSGTSFATPHVSGAAALIGSFEEGFGYGRIRDALFAGVDPLRALEGRTMTGGRLNLAHALTQLGMCVAGSSPGKGEVISSPVMSVTILFNDPYDPSSIGTDDLRVNGVAPEGFTWVDGDSVAYAFSDSPVTIEGTQTMVVAAGSVLRASDGDAIDAWEGVFYYDTMAMAVTATTPEEDETLSGVPSEIVLEFNEPVDASSVDVSDLELDLGSVTGAIPSEDAATYTVVGLIPDGEVRYRLVEGAVADDHGTPGSGYEGHFHVDDPLIGRFCSEDVPKAIQDMATVTSSMEITSSKMIVDLDVELDIAHDFDSDLNVVLIVPGGARIELFSDVGVGGVNFEGTVLDDEASWAIPGGIAPFSGRYRPEGSLSDADGVDAQGIWTLEMTDDEGGFTGTLNSWCLVIEEEVRVPLITGVHRDKHVAGGAHLSDGVEVTFASQTGHSYDVYVTSDLASPSWTIEASAPGAGVLTTYADAGPVFVEKYYRIGVQGTNPVIYSPNEAGVLPVTCIGKSALESAQGAMLGISLESTEPGGTLQDVIGWQTQGTADPDSSTEMWAFNAATSSYRMAWLFDSGGTLPTLDGHWIDPNLGSDSTLAMPAGTGFWVYNKTASNQEIVLDGLVRRTELPISIGVKAAGITAHQIGQPMAVNVPLSEPGTTFLADGAGGGMDPDLMDEIWSYTQMGDAYKMAWLFDSKGSAPSMDGVWIDPNTGIETTIELKRGSSWWYYSKPDASRTPSWTWTEPVPY